MVACVRRQVFKPNVILPKLRNYCSHCKVTNIWVLLKLLYLDFLYKQSWTFWNEKFCQNNWIKCNFSDYLKLTTDTRSPLKYIIKILIINCVTNKCFNFTFNPIKHLYKLWKNTFVLKVEQITVFQFPQIIDKMLSITVIQCKSHCMYKYSNKNQNIIIKMWYSKW